MRKTKRALALALSAVMLMQPVVNTGALKAYAAGVGIEINEANFPDATFREYLSEKIDTSEDGALSTSEITAVTEMSITDPKYAGITDLTGIESFTNLETLNCSSHRIETLDVTMFPKLKKLDCSSTRIKELDIRKNSALEDLNCSSTQIGALDTTYNEDLLYLDCSDNSDLKELSVVKSEKLLTFNFAKTSITEMDFSTLTNLKALNCSNTALKELDLLTNKDLKILYCNLMSALNSLDMSGYNDLLAISCGGSSLTKLDVSNNPSLQVLVCSGKNGWTGYYDKTDGEGAVAVAEPVLTKPNQSLVSLDLTGDSALEVLDCSYCKLDSLDVSSFENLRYLDVSSNKLTDESNFSVSANANLTHYYCNNNTFSAIDVSKNTKLLELGCDGNELMTLDVSKNPNLKKLDCGNNHLVCLDVTKCAEGISVGCGNNSRNISLDTVQYEYDLSFDGFVGAQKGNNAENKAGVASLREVSSGGIINAYKLIPELGAEKVTYTYFYGTGPYSETFTLNINNPLKVTVILNYGKDNERSVAPKGATQLLVGDSMKLTAVHSDSYKKGAEESSMNFIPNFTWSSSDDTVATVDEKTGVLKAVGAGKADINGYIAGNLRGYIEVEVLKPVEEIVIDKEISLESGGDNNEYTFKPQVLPADASNKELTYTSSNPDVAIVDSAKGIVTARGKGTTTITCKAKDGSDTYAECIVTVVQRVTALELPESNRVKYMIKNKEEQIVATVKPENAEDLTVIWESDNPSVVSVDDDGVLKSLATGEAHVTCKSVDNPKCKATYTIVVLEEGSAVKLNATSCNLVIGGSAEARSFKLEITEKDAAFKDEVFTWDSMNTSIANVNPAGEVTVGTEPGKTVVRCKIGASVLAECEVNVEQLCSSILVPGPEIDAPETPLGKRQHLLIGEEYTLKPTISPETTTNKDVKWTSKDTKIATVNSKGVVKAVGEGTVIIVCESVGNPDVKYECQILVKKPVKEIKFTETTVKAFVGQYVRIEPKISPADATDQGITWKSSDESVAMVSSGLVLGVSKGKATITATASDGSGVVNTIEVSVTQPVEQITLNTDVMVLKKGKSTTLKATIGPSNATKKSVKWTTNNKKAVTVSSSGKITAKGAAGSEAMITCTAKDGSGKYATCRVIVGTPVTKVKLNKTSATVKKGKQITLKVKLSPKTPTYTDVKWKSSKEKVATVDGGVVTGVKKGTATITCTAADGSKKKATCKITVK